jgi:hypothetical protein
VKAKGKRLPGKPKCGAQHDIEINLNKLQYERMDWILLAQDKNQSLALINTAMNISVP